MPFLPFNLGSGSVTRTGLPFVWAACVASHFVVVVVVTLFWLVGRTINSSFNQVLFSYLVVLVPFSFLFF